MSTFLYLRILKCSPLQSTLRTLERSSPRLLCRRSLTKQASFIVHIQNHDEVPGIYVHLICELCLKPMRYNWSWEIYTYENNLVINNWSAVNCVWYVCIVNKLSFEMNIYVISVRSMYIYLWSVYSCAIWVVLWATDRSRLQTCL